MTCEIKGIGKFPSGKNLGSGTMTQYPHGIVDASLKGVLTTSEGEQFVWWAHEKDKIAESGKVKGLTTLTGFTNSHNLSWMNNLIMANKSEFDPASQKDKRNRIRVEIVYTSYIHKMLYRGRNSLPLYF